MTYRPDETTVRDGFMQAIDKTYDEAHEISRLLREHFGPDVPVTTSDLELVKRLLSEVNTLTKVEDE